MAEELTTWDEIRPGMMIDVQMIDGPEVWVGTRVLELSAEKILLGKWSTEGRTLFALELTPLPKGFEHPESKKRFRLRPTDVEEIKRKRGIDG